MTIPGSIQPPEPASSKRLLGSTLIAIAVAAAILVTIVMPAEYGVDPTGIGRVLGLKQMGEIKMQLAREEAGQGVDTTTASSGDTAVPAAGGLPASTAVARSDTTHAVLAPGQAKELKLIMHKDAQVTYSWSTNRGVVNYDTHADNATTRYHGYSKGTGARADSGVLTAAFEGEHGWFWRNRGSDTVTVTLQTKGAYQGLRWVQ